MATVLRGLPSDLRAAVVVVQHLDPQFFANLAGWLDSQSSLPTTVAQAGEVPLVGRVYVAKGPDHLVLGPKRTFEYRTDPETPFRPSVDALFTSLARNAPWPGVAALLTGMGRDGAQGLLALRRAGWTTLAQDEKTCEIFGMPKAALELGAAGLTLPLDSIAAVAAKAFSPHGRTA
ncbi:hypothetical protein JCM15519_29540 [Fundidesulfovibrio butyratiphilus]